MTAAIIALLILMISHGIIRKYHYIQEVPITIRTWLGSFLAYWWGYFIGVALALYACIAPRKYFEDNLTTISQAQKVLEEAYREMGIDIKDEENDH